jgi:hypothetical protein
MGCGQHGNGCFGMMLLYLLGLSTMQWISMGSLFALACMAMAVVAWLNCPFCA